MQARLINKCNFFFLFALDGTSFVLLTVVMLASWAGLTPTNTTQELYNGQDSRVRTRPEHSWLPVLIDGQKKHVKTYKCTNANTILFYRIYHSLDGHRFIDHSKSLKKIQPLLVEQIVIAKHPSLAYMCKAWYRKNNPLVLLVHLIR